MRSVGAEPFACDHEFDLFHSPKGVVEVCVKCNYAKPVSGLTEIVVCKACPPLTSYPGNGRKDNGQLVCGCWGVVCGGHEDTPIGEAL
jgi:hypothetical protein